MAQNLGWSWVIISCGACCGEDLEALGHGTLFLECEILWNYHDFIIHEEAGRLSFILPLLTSSGSWRIFASSVMQQPQEKETAETKWFLIAANCSKSAQHPPFWKIHKRTCLKSTWKPSGSFWDREQSQAFQWEPSQAFQSNPRLSWGNSS